MSGELSLLEMIKRSTFMLSVAHPCDWNTSTTTVGPWKMEDLEEHQNYYRKSKYSTTKTNLHFHFLLLSVTSLLVCFYTGRGSLLSCWRMFVPQISHFIYENANKGLKQAGDKSRGCFQGLLKCWSDNEVMFLSPPVRNQNAFTLSSPPTRHQTICFIVQKIYPTVFESLYKKSPFYSILL